MRSTWAANASGILVVRAGRTLRLLCTLVRVWRVAKGRKIWGYQRDEGRSAGCK